MSVEEAEEVGMEGKDRALLNPGIASVATRELGQGLSLLGSLTFISITHSEPSATFPTIL